MFRLASQQFLGYFGRDFETETTPDSPFEKILMKVSQHIAVSLPVAGGVYAVSGSWQMAAASVAGGVLVDVDHLLDYFIEYGAHFSIKNFFSSFPEGRYRRIFIPLHGWEWIVVGTVLAWLTGWNVWIVGFMIGFCHHMLTDQLMNSASPLGYSLVWRLATGFDPSRAFSKNRGYAWNCGKKEAQQWKR